MLSMGCSSVDQLSVFESRRVYADLDRLERSQHAANAPAGLASDDMDSPPGRLHSQAITEGGYRLAVEEAVLMVIENNRDLRVQRLTPQITATFEQIERGVFDPEIFARTSIIEERAVEVSRATEESFSAEREDTAYEAGVRQRLPTGTDVEMGVTSDRATSNRSPEQQTARVGLTVTQSLLRGFGPAVNMASIEQAVLETVASEFELQAYTEAIVAQAERTYWLYTLAQQRIAIFEESLRVAEQQQTEVQDRIEIGVLPRTEKAAADAEVAQREQELIDARAELHNLRFRLLRLVSPRDGQNLDASLATTSDPAMEAAVLNDVADRVLLAVQNRPELGEARVRLEQARLETVVTRNGVLPRLDFFLAMGKTGYSDSFSEAFGNLDDDTFDLEAGFELSASLGNRAARGRQQGATLSRTQAVESIANLEQLVQLDVRLAVSEVERARQQITASAATRRLREEAVRAEQERFRVGTSTSLLIAQAQRDLLESQISEVDARIAYRLALVDLYLAEGSLLQRRGLSVASRLGD
jgi:outer membrane protein